MSRLNTGVARLSTALRGRLEARRKQAAQSVIARQGSWYHRIEVMPGLVTPGCQDSPAFLARLDELGLPRDCRGLRALDIGCRDGFFAFELERRGADVTGIDHVLPTNTGFAVARRFLRSRVRYLVENVYDLAPGKHGTFDLVLFLGVLYHLRNPLLGLDRIRGISRPGGSLYVETQLVDNCLVLADGSITPLAAVAPRLLEVPIVQFYPGGTLQGDPTNKWAPNMAGLRCMLEEAQFRVLETRVDGARGWAKAVAVSDAEVERYRARDYGRGC